MQLLFEFDISHFRSERSSLRDVIKHPVQRFYACRGANHLVHFLNRLVVLKPAIA